MFDYSLLKRNGRQLITLLITIALLTNFTVSISAETMVCFDKMNTELRNHLEELADDDLVGHNHFCESIDGSNVYQIENFSITVSEVDMSSWDKVQEEVLGTNYLSFMQNGGSEYDWEILVNDNEQRIRHKIMDPYYMELADTLNIPWNNIWYYDENGLIFINDVTKAEVLELANNDLVHSLNYSEWEEIIITDIDEITNSYPIIDSYACKYPVKKIETEDSGDKIDESVLSQIKDNVDVCVAFKVSLPPYDNPGVENIRDFFYKPIFSDYNIEWRNVKGYDYDGTVVAELPPTMINTLALDCRIQRIKTVDETLFLNRVLMHYSSYRALSILRASIGLEEEITFGPEWDVDQNGKFESYDALLALRESIGLISIEWPADWAFPD